MTFFKAVFALYFAAIALAVPFKAEEVTGRGTSCEEQCPLGTRLIAI